MIANETDFLHEELQLAQVLGRPILEDRQTLQEVVNLRFRPLLDLSNYPAIILFLDDPKDTALSALDRCSSLIRDIDKSKFSEEFTSLQAFKLDQPFSVHLLFFIFWIDLRKLNLVSHDLIYLSLSQSTDLFFSEIMNV